MTEEFDPMAQARQKNTLQTADTKPKLDDAAELPPPDGEQMNSDQLLNEEVIMTSDIITSETTIRHSEDMSPRLQTAELQFQANQTMPLSISYDPIDQNIGPMGDIMPEQSACARNDTCSETKESETKQNKQTRDKPGAYVVTTNATIKEGNEEAESSTWTVDRNKDRRVIPDTDTTDAIRHNTACSVDGSWLDHTPSSIVHDARSIFTIPEDIQINETTSHDKTSPPELEPMLATREVVPTKATIAKAKQEEIATEICKNNWATSLNELCAAREHASKMDQHSRVAILLNCNGLQPSRYTDIVNKAVEAQADIIALTEAHVKASSLEEREQQEASWARQQPGWTFHFAANDTKRAGGVAFVHRKHLKYDVFRGINNDGRPVIKAMEHQGRYIIAVPSNRTEDRTDMVIVYANNSGNTGDDFSEHKRLAHDIQRLREFYETTHPDRVLMTLGDLNFSSPSSRSVKPTTSKVAKQTSEAPIQHHAIGEPHDYEKWDRDPCSNQGFRPGINDDEYAFAKTSWIKPGILDVVTYRAHAVGKCTHSPDKPGWMQTPDELDYCAKLRHTAELPGWNQQAARRKNQYIRATLDYILVNKLDLEYVCPQKVTKEAVHGIASGCIFASIIPFNSDVAKPAKCSTDHSMLVVAYQVTRPLTFDDNRRWILGMGLKYLVGAAGGEEDKTGVGWGKQSAALEMSRDYVQRSGFLTSFMMSRSICAARQVLRTDTPKHWTTMTQPEISLCATSREYILKMAKLYKEYTFHMATENAARLIQQWEDEVETEEKIVVSKHPDDLRQVIWQVVHDDGANRDEIAERAGLLDYESQPAYDDVNSSTDFTMSKEATTYKGTWDLLEGKWASDHEEYEKWKQEVRCGWTNATIHEEDLEQSGSTEVNRIETTCKSSSPEDKPKGINKKVNYVPARASIERKVLTKAISKQYKWKNGDKRTLICRLRMGGTSVPSTTTQQFRQYMPRMLTDRLLQLINQISQDIDNVCYKRTTGPLKEMWSTMQGTQQQPVSMAEAIWKMARSIESAWSRTAIKRASQADDIDKTAEADFNTAYRRAKTLRAQAKRDFESSCRSLKASTDHDGGMRLKWEWVMEDFLAQREWYHLLDRGTKCVRTNFMMNKHGLKGEDRIRKEESGSLTAWTCLEKRTANMFAIDIGSTARIKQHSGDNKSTLYGKGPEQYIRSRDARKALAIPIEDLMVPHNLLIAAVQRHRSSQNGTTWVCIRWGTLILRSKTKDATLPSIKMQSRHSRNSMLNESEMCEVFKQLDLDDTSTTKIKVMIQNKIGKIITHSITTCNDTHHANGIWLVDVDGDTGGTQLIEPVITDTKSHREWELQLTKQASAPKHTCGNSILWGRITNHVIADNGNPMSPIYKWLQNNASHQRWTYDDELQHLNPKYMRKAPCGIMAGSACDARVERAEILAAQLQNARNSEQNSSSGNCIDIRERCEHRTNSAMIIHAWVGSMSEPEKRIRLKVLLDSGCSMVVARSNLQHTLAHLGVKTRPTKMPGPLIHAAVSGPIYDSSGIMDLGITFTNANHLGAGQGPPTKEMFASAWLVKDLSYDLILGMPAFEGILTQFDWNSTISDPNCRMLDNDGHIPLDGPTLLQMTPECRVNTLTAAPIHIREQAIGNQQALTAASWRDEIDEHIKNDQLNCDKAKFATERAKATLRDARSADNKATAQQALKVANDALMAADNSKRCLKTRAMVKMDVPGETPINIQIQHEKSESSEAILTVLELPAHCEAQAGSNNGSCIVTAVLPGVEWQNEQQVDVFGSVGSYETGMFNINYEIHDSRSTIKRDSHGICTTKLRLHWHLADDPELRDDSTSGNLAGTDASVDKLQFVIQPGIPLGWAKTPESQDVINTVWRNEDLDVLVEQNIRDQARSIAYEWRKKMKSAEIGEQRHQAETFIDQLLKGPEVWKCTDHEHIANLLTWVAHLVMAAPHLTRNILGNHKWLDVMRKVKRNKDSCWIAAKTAQEFLFTLLKANQLGLRDNELNDDLILNEESHIKSAIVLANLPNLEKDLHTNNLHRYSNYAWQRLAMLGDLLCGDGVHEDEERQHNSTNGEDEEDDNRQTPDQDIMQTAQNWGKLLKEAKWKESTDKTDKDIKSQIQLAKRKHLEKQTVISNVTPAKWKEIEKAGLKRQSTAIKERLRKSNSDAQCNALTVHDRLTQESIMKYKDVRDLSTEEYIEICSNLEAGQFNNASTPTSEIFHEQYLMDHETEQRKQESELSEDKRREMEAKVQQRLNSDIRRKEHSAKMKKSREDLLEKQRIDAEACRGSEATRETPEFLHDIEMPFEEEDSNMHPEDTVTQHTYGTVEDDADRLPIDSEVDWIPTELERDTQLYKIWNNITERQRRHLKLIEWMPKGKTIRPGSGEGLDDLTVSEAEAQERALIHTMVIHLGKNYMDTWDVDPWSPPLVKTHLFGPEYLTMITKEPVFIPPRPLADEQLKAAIKQTEEMIKSGLAIRAVSAWNSPVLCVPKPLGRGETKRKFRTCVDARGINSRTVKISYPLQPTHEALEQAQGYDRYTCSDACAGFHQLAVAPSVAHKLAYSCGTSMKVIPLRMAMGGVNSMSAFLYCLDRAIGYMRTGCCKLSERNGMIREARALHRKQLEQNKKVERTKFELGTHPRRRFAETDQEMEEMWTCLGQSDRVKMLSYMDLAEKEYPVQDGQIPMELPHPCQGVTMMNTRHRCIGSAYVDDVLQGFTSSGIGSQYRKMMEGLGCISKLLGALDEHGIRLKAQKTSIMQEHLAFLGWDLSSKGLRPNDKRCQGIKAMTDPKSTSEIKSVLGGLQYFRRLIPNCSQLEAPLYALTRKGAVWDYKDEIHGESIRQLKNILASDAILTPWDPNGGRACLLVDTSAVAAGAVLAQENDKGEERPCAYASAQLTVQQRGYSASEREMIGVRLAFTRFRHMIAQHHLTSGKGSRQMTKLITDHDALKQTIQSRSLNPRLNSWAMGMMGWQCEVEVRAGQKLALPDMLSRCTSNNDVLRAAPGKESVQWILKAGLNDDYYEKAPDYGKSVRIHYVKGPTEVTSSEASKPMTQRTRRDMRYFMRSALCNIERHLEQQGNAQEQFKHYAEQLREGLKAGSNLDDEYQLTNDYTEPLEHTPKPCTLMEEEKYIAKIVSEHHSNGMTNIIRMGLGENLTKSDEAYASLEKQYGEDWYTRIAKVEENGNDSGVWVYETTSCTPLDKIIRDIVPEDEIPQIQHDESFMMALSDDSPYASDDEDEDDNIDPGRDQYAKQVHQVQAILTQYEDSIHQDDMSDSDHHYTSSDSSGCCVNTEVLCGFSEEATNAARSTQHVASASTSDWIQPTMADNFCGIGGVLRGFIEEGFNIGTTCEKAWEQQKLLREEFQGAIDPMRTFESLTWQQFLGHFTAFSSAPCTPFSRAGSQRGFHDHRASLYMRQVIPLIQAQVPVIWCENVPEVSRQQKRNIGDLTATSPLQELSQILKDKGYHVSHKDINALDCGAAISRKRTIVQAIHPKLHKWMMTNRDVIANKLSKHMVEIRSKNDETQVNMQEHEFTEDGFIWPNERFRNQRDGLSEQHASSNPDSHFHIKLNQTLAHHMVPWEEVPNRYKMNPDQLVDFEADVMYKEAVIHVARRQDDRSLGDWHNPSIIISADGAAASITALGNSRFVQDSDGNTRRLMPCEMLAIMGFQIKQGALFKTVLQTKDSYYGKAKSGKDSVLNTKSQQFALSEKFHGVQEISNKAVQHMLKEHIQDKQLDVQLGVTDSTLYQWAGNAVPVPMSASIARATMAMYDQDWMKRHCAEVWTDMQPTIVSTPTPIEAKNDSDNIALNDQDRDTLNLFKASLSQATAKSTEELKGLTTELRDNNTLIGQPQEPSTSRRRATRTRNRLRQDIQFRNVKGKVAEAQRSIKCTTYAYRQMRRYMGLHAHLPGDDHNTFFGVEDVHHICESHSTGNMIESIIKELHDEELQAGGGIDDIVASVEETVKRFTTTNNGTNPNITMVQLDPATTANEIKVAMTMTEKSPRITHAEISAAISKKHKRKGKGNNGTHPVDTSIAWKEMRNSQMLDPQYRTLIQFHENNKIPENPMKRVHLETKDAFVMQNNLLYKVWDSAVKHDGIFMQLCIPREYQLYLVRQYHNKLGHPSHRTMYEALRRRYYWPTCFSDCNSFTKWCDSCQRYKDTKPMAKVGLTQYSHDAGEPGQTVLIDAIGPYGGARHVTTKTRNSAIVIQDEFSRLVKIYPVEFVNSEHISWCLMDWAETFGWMCNIKSDCASNMISDGIQQFYKDAGIDKSQSAAYRPQSHGKIERVIEYINSTVRTTMAGRKQGWDRIAGAMASAWNALPKSMLHNNCPFYLMFGRRPPNQVDLHPHFPKGTEQHRLKDWVMNSLTRIQDYRRFMAVGLQQHKLDMLYKQQKYANSRAGIDFEIGDKVKIFLAMTPARGGLATKLQARYASGYVIAERLNKETWLVKRELGDGKSMPIHSSRLKEYRDPQDPKGLTPIITIQDDGFRDDTVPQALADIIIMDAKEGRGDLGDQDLVLESVKAMQIDLQSPLDEEVFIDRMNNPEWEMALEQREQTTDRITRCGKVGTRDPNRLEEQHKFHPESKDDWNSTEAFNMPDTVRTEHSAQVETARKQTAIATSDADMLNCIKWDPDLIQNLRKLKNSKKKKPKKLKDGKIKRKITLRDVFDMLEMTLPTVVTEAGPSQSKGAYMHLLDLNAPFFHRDLRSVSIKPNTLICVGELMMGAYSEDFQVVQANRSDIGEADEEFAVERILDSKITSDGREMFKVQWKPLRNQAQGEITWEPKAHLSCSNELTLYRDRVARQAYKKTTHVPTTMQQDKADRDNRESIIMFTESLDDFAYPQGIGTLSTPVDHSGGGVQVQRPEGSIKADSTDNSADSHSEEEGSHDSREGVDGHPDTQDNTKLDQEETKETAEVKLETESHKDIAITGDAPWGLGLNEQDDHEQQRIETETWEIEMWNTSPSGPSASLSEPSLQDDEDFESQGMRFDENDKETDEARWSIGEIGTEEDVDTLNRDEAVMALEVNTTTDDNATTVETPEEDWEEKMKLLEVRNPEEAAEFITALKNTYKGFSYKNIDDDDKRYVNFQRAVNQLEGKTAKAESRKDKVGIKGVQLEFGPKFLECKMMNIIMTQSQFHDAEKTPDLEQEISIEFTEENEPRVLGATIRNIVDNNKSGSPGKKRTQDITLEVKVSERQHEDIDATKGDLFIKHRHNATERIEAAISKVHGGENVGCNRLRDIIRRADTENSYESILKDYEDKWEVQMSKLKNQQRESVKQLYDHRISVIKGPPGCGKTKVTTQIATMAAYANKMSGNKRKVIVSAPMNATVEDLVYQLSRKMDPELNRIKVVWFVSKSHLAQVPERTEEFTLNNLAIRQPSGYEQPLGIGAQEQLVKLHNKRNERSMNLPESQLIHYRTLLKAAAAKILRDCDVIVCTTLQLGASLIQSQEYELGIIEEAGLVSEPEAHLMMAIAPRQLLFVGDDKQMRARFSSDQVARLKLGSAFERACEIECIPTTLLDEQHRMPGACIHTSNAIFYEGKIKTDASMEGERAQDNKMSGLWKDHNKPITWIDTGQLRSRDPKPDAQQFNEEKQRGKGSSLFNRGEASECINIAKWIVDSSGSDSKGKQLVQARHITILTMYTGQVTEIKTELSRHPALKDVEVQTVNQYQGRENRIVIISLVRTTPTTSEFLRDPGRINVALTRQTHGLVIVGDLDNFKRLQNRNQEGKMVDSIWGGVCKEIVSVMGQLTREVQANKSQDNTETVHAVTELQIQQDYQMKAGVLDTETALPGNNTVKDEAVTSDEEASDSKCTVGAPSKLKWTSSDDNWYHAERAVLEGNCKAINAMHKAGLDINIKLADGTPLIQLARNENMIQHLAEMKADVSATNGKGWTLLKRLTMGIATEDNSMRCLRAAIAAGADTSVNIHVGYTIKSWTMKNRQTLSDFGLNMQTTAVEETAATTESDQILKENEVAEVAMRNRVNVDASELTEQDEELRQYRLKYRWRILLETLTYKMMNANFLKHADIAKSFKKDPNKDECPKNTSPSNDHIIDALSQRQGSIAKMSRNLKVKSGPVPAGSHMSIDDEKATMGTGPPPKDNPFLMGLRNADVIAMFRYVAHLARELHKEARLVGPSSVATQARDPFGRKSYLKEQEQANLGSQEDRLSIENWSHPSKSKQYAREADEPRWDRVKRVLATCLSRANKVCHDNQGIYDDWTRNGREDITKAVERISDFHSYLDFRDDDRATRDITNNKHSKGIAWGKVWREDIHELSVNGVMGPPDINYRGNTEESYGLNGWNKNVSSMQHAHYLFHRREITHMEVMQERLSNAKAYDARDIERERNMSTRDNAYLREAVLIQREAHRKCCRLWGTRGDLHIKVLGEAFKIAYSENEDSFSKPISTPKDIISAALKRLPDVLSTDPETQMIQNKVLEQWSQGYNFATILLHIVSHDVPHYDKWVERRPISYPGVQGTIENCRTLQSVTEDTGLQSRGVSILHNPDGTGIDLSHASPEATNWQLDRHNKLCGSEFTTGKPATEDVSLEIMKGLEARRAHLQAPQEDIEFAFSASDANHVQLPNSTQCLDDNDTTATVHTEGCQALRGEEGEQPSSSPPPLITAKQESSEHGASEVIADTAAVDTTACQASRCEEGEPLALSTSPETASLPDTEELNTEDSPETASQTLGTKQASLRTEWLEGSDGATRPEIVLVVNETTDSSPRGPPGQGFWAMDPENNNHAATQQPEMVSVASEATDSFPKAMGCDFWAMDPENSNYTVKPQEGTAGDEIEMIAETVMKSTTVVNSTGTETNQEPTQLKEDSQSHHQKDKVAMEWNQSRVERNYDEDGHHLVLNLNEPGKETPPWASEEPGGTIVAQAVVMRLNGHTVRCFSEAFGKWTEEFENANEDTWAIDNEVLEEVGDIWETFAIAWREPLNKGTLRGIKVIIEEDEEVHAGIEFQHTTLDIDTEDSKMVGTESLGRFPWGRAMGSSAHFMSRSSHCKGNLLKRYVCWEKSESGRVDIRGCHDPSQSGFKQEEETGVGSLTRRELMIKMTDWVRQAGEHMKYYSNEKDTEEACGSLISDVMVPLQFGRQCKNSGEFIAEKEAEGGNLLRWRNQKANEVQIGSSSQAERERWRREQSLTRTFKDLETLKENGVIVSITNAAGKVMPKTAMARIDINATDISDQMAEVQTPMVEANMEGKGTCYRLQIWEVPKGSDRRKIIREEVTNLTKQAERHPGQVYLIDNIPAKLKKEVMEALMLVNNVHFTKELWNFIKTFEQPSPRPKVEAKAAATRLNTGAGKKHQQRGRRTNRRRGRKCDTE